MPNPIRVINVKVAKLRSGCPCCHKSYNSLDEWLQHPNHVYIGRRVFHVKASFDSKWKNPFPVGKKFTRETCLEAFRKYILKDTRLLQDISSELSGKTLGCWCHPLACHGHILKEIAESEKQTMANQPL
jgi:hypothetical protein